ncbi:hypothetical protein TNCV_3317241 [Trichonephila clavipes]|nr:hypothetical protein TNCV_3317241 [Trichonephila clavipes]
MGGVSASKYGSLPFGSHALYATGGRVRDLVDVVGRLGNASRREPTLACPQPWKRALETHVERSHQNALAHGMPSDGEPIELSIPNDPQVITVNHLHDPRTSCSRSVTLGIPTLLREGHVEPHGGERNRTTKNFLRALETLPEFNDAFQNFLHEDVSDCTILPICQIPTAV